MVEFELDIDWGRTVWILGGLALVAAVLFVLYSFVGTFVFGLFIYYATRRLYRRIQYRVGQRSVAAGLSLVLIALPALALLYYTLAIGVQQFSEAADELQGTGFQDQLGPVADTLARFPEVTEAIDDPMSIVGGAAGVGTVTESFGVFVGAVGILGTGLLHLFVMFALAFYLLRDGRRLAHWSRQYTNPRGTFRRYARAVDDSLDKVFYGNILNAIITGTVGAVAFSLLNLIAPEVVAIPYAALMGLLAGAASLIPVVGMKLVYVPLGIYLAALAAVNGEGWWFVALFAGVAFVIVDTIPDLVVRPYVSGGSLHTGALMFAYILGPLIWGWYGLFLGPMVLVFVTHFATIVVPELLDGHTVDPVGVDPANVVDGAVPAIDGASADTTTAMPEQTDAESVD